MINSSWIEKQLSEVCTEITSGGAAPQGDKYFINGSHPFVRVVDMGKLSHEKYLAKTRDVLNESGVSKLREFPSGTILFTKSGASLLLNQRAILKIPMYVVSHIGCLIPNDCVTSDWLYYWMKIVDFGKYAHATTLPSLKLSTLKELTIPVPPLEEQQRIVARIEELFSELDAAVATLEQTKEQLAVYRQAVLKEAFEEISEFVTLQSISEKIFDGPFGSNLKTADYTTSGIRVVRLENLKNGWFDDSKQSFVTSDKYEKISSHTVYPTDLIMSTFISDAIKVCQLPEYIEYAVNKADCVGIRLKESVNQRYVMYYLLTQQAFSSLEHNVHGATRPRVNTTHIKEINVPICDRKKQNQIVSEVESRLSVCDKIEETVTTALQEAEAMRQSILKQAFAGEL